MREWLVDRWEWPAAALFGAILMLVLAPAFAAGREVAVTLVFLQLPAYFLHQYEEHRGDRFRTYANATLFGGREALSRMDAFVINLVALWMLDLVALTLAAFVAPGWGLLATDVAILNAIAHAAIALARREYNPGLWTALVLFVPLGGGTFAVLTVGGATWEQQAVGFAVGIIIHAAIVVRARTRAATRSTAAS